MIADWPGLSAARLCEGRDLAPTLDLHAVQKAVAIDHLGLPEADVETLVFPDSRNAVRLQDLVSI